MGIKREWFRVNRPLVPIKIAFVLFHFGIYISEVSFGTEYTFDLFAGWSLLFPFITIQMRSLGLNFQDVSLVTGLTPLVTTFTTPIFGRKRVFFIKF